MKPLALLIALLVVGAIPALADERHRTFRAKLSGYNEVVPAGGAISTRARGKFKAEIDEDAQTIHYELSYEGLEFDVSQAHIHFGQRHTSGGISVFLCQTAGAPHPVPGLQNPAITPICPGPRSGTVTGMITPAEIFGPVGQGIAVAELVRAIRAGVTYANVHSGTAAPPVGFPSGETRGQIHRGHGRDD